MKTIFVVAALALVLTAGSARAQQPPPEPKSPKIAIALSLAGTAVGLTALYVGAESDDGLVFLGGSVVALMAPSAGTDYAGGRNGLYIGLRAVTQGLILITAFSHAVTEDHQDETPPSLTGDRTFQLGLVMYGLVSLLEVSAAASAADEHNRRLQLAPMAAPGMAGLSLAGTF